MAQQGSNVRLNIARMRLAYWRVMMITHVSLWAGLRTCSQRDYDLIHSCSVDFVGYDNTSFLMKIVHQLHPDSLTPTTYWTRRCDLACRQMVLGNGAQSPGVFTAIRIPEECPGVSSGTTGFLWSIPSKMKFIEGPSNAIIIHDCTASPEGTLQLIPHIASRKWDILLLEETEPYEYPWLVTAIHDSGSFADLRHDPTDPRQQRALESLERGGRP
ncbi:uncharacterized protein F4812DRAFT_471325 [Daldinia caldariorum]|uniref:uncharacterized protein n=1 Tax=Daldinia caldariorum TaxID=326644 RepID=UPI002007F927|nr:uncharacterized protein F4812DRAFT_471325 [Daldinia caldariorum]KAI1468059.1 hypothetical protein F4812DRAFT_471325 [Daldinia caldariorum]